MLLDKRSACRKYRRKSQEQTADDRPEASGNEAGNHGHRPTKRKPDQVLVPASFVQGGKVELDEHRIPKRIDAIPNATMNHTTRLSIVAAKDAIINFLRRTQTVQL
jgi:hypothetical protein